MTQPWPGNVVEIDGVPHILPHNDKPNPPGITAFLRYPEFQRSLVRAIAARSAPDFRLLVAPGSIGCEALTLAILAKEAGLFDGGRSLVIDTLDLSARFTALARQNLYPESAIRHLPPAMKAHFNACAQSSGALVSAADTVHGCVNILPRGSLLDFQPAEAYDAVLCVNLLQYAGEFRPAFLDKLASLSRGMICVNRIDQAFGAANNPFHDAGFRPVGLPGNREPSPAPRKPAENWNCISVFAR